MCFFPVYTYIAYLARYLQDIFTPICRPFSVQPKAAGGGRGGKILKNTEVKTRIFEHPVDAANCIIQLIQLYKPLHYRDKCGWGMDDIDRHVD